MDSIAHIRSKDGSKQTVWEHSKNVAKLSSRFGSKIGARHLAFVCGLLHDIGKFSLQQGQKCYLRIFMMELKT